MIKKENLLSIGELSKLTGVNIKALRYYDSIGILKPVYVNPDTGYRYYSFYQKADVDAIQLCVDVGIPLKHFNDYTSGEAARIQYKDLVMQGMDSIEEKIRTMQERLARLKSMQAEIQRAEIISQSREPQRFERPSRTCWITPYDGQLGNSEANSLIKKLILEIHNHHLSLGNVYGLLLLCRGKVWEQFLFVDVQASEQIQKQYPQIIHIRAGQYLRKKIETSGITQAWDWILPLVPEEQVELIIETELFMGNYSFSNPVWEQQCLLAGQDGGGLF